MSDSERMRLSAQIDVPEQRRDESFDKVGEVSRAKHTHEQQSVGSLTEE